MLKKEWILPLILLSVLGLFLIESCGQKFAELTYSISGTITGTKEVTVNLSGEKTMVATTDVSGNFEFTNLPSGNYHITPTKLSYQFTPSSREVTLSGANVTDQNFSASPMKYSIAGTITWSGTPTNNNLVVFVVTDPAFKIDDPSWVQNYLVTYEVYSSISGGSQSYSVSGLNFGTYYLLAATSPLSLGSQVGDKVGEYADGLLPTRGGSPEAITTGANSSITGKDFSLKLTIQ